MFEGGEPGSLVGMGTCDAATRRQPTTDQPATPTRHRSALAAHARVTRGRRRPISPSSPYGRSSSSSRSEIHPPRRGP